MSYEVSPAKFMTCICGKVCKGRAAFANHARKCPQEIARSEAFITRIEVAIDPPASGGSCTVCGKFIRYDAVQQEWFHLDAERHRAQPGGVAP